MEQEGGLYMSPLLDANSGLLGSSPMAAWPKIWTASQYEPDVTTARTYYGGALASFGTHLYFGTINYPYSVAAPPRRSPPRRLLLRPPEMNDEQCTKDAPSSVRRR